MPHSASGLLVLEGPTRTLNTHMNEASRINFEKKKIEKKNNDTNSCKVEFRNRVVLCCDHENVMSQGRFQNLYTAAQMRGLKMESYL